MPIKADEKYAESNRVSVPWCRRCEHHYAYDDDGWIYCGRTGDISLVNVMPAQYLKGFNNGDIVVDCKREV